MSEIDVTYCKFARLNDVCASPINTQECKCSKIPIQMCYYKQRQQLKQENEELCTVIRNELPEQYDKRVNEAESDIEWGVLDRNATETEFCKNVIYETRNYIAKLKQENEELHRRQSVFNILKKIDKYKQCLDEIEGIVRNFNCKDCQEFNRCQEKRTQKINNIKDVLSYYFSNNEDIERITNLMPVLTRCDLAFEKTILQLIKQAKEGGK